jgi:hypothetical protein
MLPSSFHSIGADRWLTAAEASTWNSHPLTGPMWDVYAAQFQGFTGATLDPLFHRLRHPAAQSGSIELEPGSGVVVVGTGPSLRLHIDALHRVRERIRIFTSPRGAEALLPYGIVPDLVMIEHQTALDAHHSARATADTEASVLAACPLVAADWRTPPALLARVATRSLFVPAPLPTWGLWPATAVAMAMNAGAARVALLGVDLGTATQPDPAHAPLIALLELLARLGRTMTIDCGGGAAKSGWTKGSIETAAGVRLKHAMRTQLRTAASAGERLADAQHGLATLAPIIDRARAMRSLATDVRGGHLPAAPRLLLDAVEEMNGWGGDVRVRLLIQETLGAAFMPRLWRIGIDPALGKALWRPLLLATHELVAQADALTIAAAAVTRAA